MIDLIQTKLIESMLMKDVYKTIKPIRSRKTKQCLQHSKFKTTCFNYCTSITRQDLEDLGGFDESYANGIDFDDTDFIRRIRRKGMNINMVDSPFVVHQYHTPINYARKKSERDLNIKLFNSNEHSCKFRVFNKHTKPLVKLLVKNNFYPKVYNYENIHSDSLL